MTLSLKFPRWVIEVHGGEFGFRRNVHIHRSTLHRANGRMLMDIVDRNGLIVVNTTNKCIGTITRIRKAGNRI